MSTEPKAYIVGAGIAGLAAAALLIRDGRFPGDRIHIFEQSALAGGSLDGAGDPESGYVIRGGRMFEAHFGCTFDLFSRIPSLDDPGISVTDEILAFSRKVVSSSRCRLVVGGRRIEAPPLGLSIRDRWDLGRLSMRSERSIGAMTIEQYFQPDFFSTNFWCMWATMFAFRPWHSLIEFRRYMRRFMHLLPGFNRLEGIHRTVLNQYDSLIVPLLRWLEAQGVTLRNDTCVAAVDFSRREGMTSVNGLSLNADSSSTQIEIRDDDLVFITLGSMTEGSTLGSHLQPASPGTEAQSGAWSLWRRIAAESEAFGNPSAFCGHVPKSLWQSFTVTLDNPAFFEFMEAFSGNAAGTGGLVTFPESGWLLSIVLAHQPHFRGQPESVKVFWGYGLHPENRGDLIRKPMMDCSGQEILRELFHHLPAGEVGTQVIEQGNCIPCVMPYITSQFMPRMAGDRPAVVPARTRNFAFLGQYCEVPEDTVFTVEYSVRTAQTAVYRLLDLERPVTAMYRGYLRPGVLLGALKALW